jgi:hypothetical protein
LDLLANLFGSVVWIFAAAMVWVWLDDLMLCTNPKSRLSGLVHWFRSQRESKEKL